MHGWQIALIAVGAIGALVAVARGRTKVKHGEKPEKGWNIKITTSGTDDHMPDGGGGAD